MGSPVSTIHYPLSFADIWVYRPMDLYQANNNNKLDLLIDNGIQLTKSKNYFKNKIHPGKRTVPKPFLLMIGFYDLSGIAVILF